jgi:hypothetical protein
MIGGKINRLRTPGRASFVRPFRTRRCVCVCTTNNNKDCEYRKIGVVSSRSSGVDDSSQRNEWLAAL